MTVLEAHAITKVYREGGADVPVLKGVSLALRAGEVVALEGPSGSGKTTLLFILGCLLTPSGGRVIVDGRSLDPGRPERLGAVRKRSIGFVFQHDHLFPALTALENVEYALNLRGTRGPAARDDASRLLDAVGLVDRRDARPRDLSGGQRQRVAIDRALAGSPPILLDDEPTASLDSRLGALVLDLFRALAKREGRAVLIVTHDPRVRSIADRVLMIHDGVLDEGGPRP
jgi:putative ABC transport system ATP-binding protein